MAFFWVIAPCSLVEVYQRFRGPCCLHYQGFKYRLNPSQHGFRKFNSTATSLVTYLNSIIPSISTQGQTDSVYFDLTKAFDIVPHNILLCKLSNFGLSSSYVDWFHSYLSNTQSFIRISGTLLFPYTVKC
jgi:hypothetical protein